MYNSKKSLQIFYWNAQGVRRKSDEFFELLNKKKIDVALLQETFLKSNHELNHRDFICYRLDRMGRRCGGVAILIRRNIKHCQIPTIQTAVIENIGVEIDCHNGKSIKLISVYFPGTDNSVATMTSFNRDIKLLTYSNQSYFLCGDLNAKHRYWNCERRNTAGKLLFEEMTYGYFTISYPSEHTHIPVCTRFKPSTIDLVLTNGLHTHSQPKVSHCSPDSDHLGVGFEILSTEQNLIPDHYVPLYKNANWDKFRDLIECSIDLESVSLDDVVTTTQVDDFVSNFTEILINARNETVPMVKPNFKYKEISPEILELIAKKTLLRRRWRYYRCSHMKNELNSLSRQIKFLINRQDNQEKSNLLKKLTPANKNVWKVARALKSVVKYTPPLIDEGKTFSSNSEKCELLAKQFQKSHSLTRENPSRMDSLVEESIEQIQLCPVVNVPTDAFTDPKEVQKLVRNLKTKKAPGEDEINNNLLKHIPFKAVVFLTFILNASLKLQYYPKNWKNAIVSAIPKPSKDHSKPINFRPISLLSSISKVFEGVIIKRIRECTAALKAVPDTQFGFRPAHSCDQQITRVIQHIKTGFRHGKSTGMVIFDGEKAFDTVWQNGLLHKLYKLNFPMYLLKLIRSMVTERTYKVKVGNSLSEAMAIPAGLPQGTRSSPPLYNLFVHDIPKLTNCFVAQVADDLAIYCTDVDPQIVQRNLQRAINRITEYCDDWKIKLNASKTQVIYFTKRRSPRYLPNRMLTVHSVPVPWSQSVTYLGLTFDKALTFKKNTESFIEKAQKKIQILYPLLKRKSKLSVYNKLMIFKSIFQSTISYACPAWSNCARTHVKALQIQQNKCLKMILDLPFDHPTASLHRIAKVKTVAELLRYHTHNFYLRCKRSANELIRNLKPLDG